MSSHNEQEAYASLFEQVIALRREGEPGWMLDQRREAFEQFRRLGFPGARHEEWKYTDLRPLARSSFVLPKMGHPDEVGPISAVRRPDEVEIIFVDGVYSHAQSSSEKIPGVVVVPFEEAMNNGQAGQLQRMLSEPRVGDEDAFPSLNRALCSGGVLIRVADNQLVSKRLHMLFVTTEAAPNLMFCPRVVVEVGRSSQVTLVQTHVSEAGATCFTNVVTDVDVAANGRLLLCKVQVEGTQAYHFSYTRTRQEQDSTITHFDFSSGARLARNDINARVDGEGAHVDMFGVYAVKDKQHIDNHTVVDHRVPRGTSHQTYKGILDDAARAVFNGKIFVRQGAMQTDAWQLNKSLLLSRNARVDTKPQLEIDNDDVKCTHGATIGQLEDDQVFYLQSRGIPKREAIPLLSRGFVEDVLFSLSDQPLQASLRGLLDGYFSRGEQKA